ncbi:G0/G1 switch protein 2 [Gasterosteus aculeatus]|uniref:G0/G1 switch 2 n=1 Tax=Gasterosteus aculeatus aculeatus TaxID=481459 RepID=A0AAQ4PPT3_GASAC|nr:G0/G1 switch protein 2-like [Gasterosteus aculeatus aculeatus]
METIGEIIPFAKEMLNQRPSRGMLKVYMLGSTMAVLGVVGGLVETYFLPSAEPEAAEDAPAELIVEMEKKPLATLVRPEVVDALTTVIKAKHLVTDGQRVSRRLYAS